MTMANEDMTLGKAHKVIAKLDEDVKDIVDQLRKYSSVLSNERYPFGSEEAQREKISSLLQAVNDLTKRQQLLKLRRNLTNATTQVTINGVTATISEFLDMKDRLIPVQIKAYAALGTESAENRRSFSAASDKDVFVVQMYDEESKLKKLSELKELKNAIDADLDDINSVTQLKQL